MFLARITAHEIDNMAYWFQKSLSKAQISKINEKAISDQYNRATKFGLGVFQGKVLFLNIILGLDFTKEAEIVTQTRNNCQLLTSFKMRHKIQRLYYFTSLIHWLVYVLTCNYLSECRRKAQHIHLHCIFAHCSS